MMKIVCEGNEELFTLNENRTMVVLLFLACFPCFVVRLFITPQDFYFPVKMFLNHKGSIQCCEGVIFIA